VNRGRIGKTAAWCAVLAAMLSPLGCGSRGGLDLATVRGTVTYRGKTLDHGEVVFVPIEGTPGPQAMAAIGPDGSFTVKTAGKDGAAVGKHKVKVICRRVVTPEEAKNLVIGELLTPAIYARDDATPLSFEVKKGNNTYPIELK
jgi:hypothetical protein